MKQGQKFLGELIGTAGLLLVIVGSGIMGESLSQGNTAVALLANSLATGAGLFVLIQCLGPISGAHLNPAVSLVEFLWRRLNHRNLLSYWTAQFLGGILGVWVTHGIFGQQILQISNKNRYAPHLWVSETVATFGLLCTIALAGRKRIEAAPTSIAAYVTGAYWFTSSTSFANPAVTLARTFTETFCGIAPAGVPFFIGAQVLGAFLAFAVTKKLIRESSPKAP